MFLLRQWISRELRVRQARTAPKLVGRAALAIGEFRARVVVIASDRNVRNKARLAGLSVLRPDNV